MLDAYIAAGGNFIDTADGYSAWVEGHSGGESETVLGERAAERGNRDQLVIATKVGSKPDRRGLEAATVEAALSGSLQRLQTDLIDLYYCISMTSPWRSPIRCAPPTDSSLPTVCATSPCRTSPRNACANGS